MAYKILAICILVLAAPLSCSTTGTQKKPNTEELLDSQKSVIVGYLDSGQAQMAHKELRTLLKDHKDDADLNNLMGLTNLALNNKQRALVHFRKSHALDPKTAISLNLASCLLELDRNQEAIDVLEKAKNRAGDTYPYPERLEHNLGLAYEKMKRNDLAKKQYEAALVENPSFYLSLLQLGRMYQRQSQVREAIAKLNLAHVACPVCFDPVQSLVTLYQAEKRSKDAQSLLNGFLREKNVPKDDLARARELNSKIAKTAQLNPKK